MKRLLTLPLILWFCAPLALDALRAARVWKRQTKARTA